MFCLFLISSYLLLPPLFKSPILSPPTFPSVVQTEKLSCFLSGKIPSLELVRGTPLNYQNQYLKTYLATQGIRPVVKCSSSILALASHVVNLTTYSIPSAARPTSAPGVVNFFLCGTDLKTKNKKPVDPT